MSLRQPDTKTWADYDKERNQPQDRQLGATFALLVLAISVMFKIAHIY